MINGYKPKPIFVNTSVIDDLNTRLCNRQFTYKNIHRFMMQNNLCCFRNTRYCTAQKISFPLRISYVNMTNPQFPTDLVTFTEKNRNGKLHFYNVGFIELQE